MTTAKTTERLSIRARIRKICDDWPFAALALPMVFITCLPLPLALLLGSDDDGPAANAAQGVESATTQVEPPPAKKPVRDPTKKLIDRIKNGEYKQRSDVATSRFLEEFDAKAFKLHDVDFNMMTLERRGRDWVVVRAPFQPMLEREGTARLRFIRTEGAWKLEDLKTKTNR